MRLLHTLRHAVVAVVFLILGAGSALAGVAGDSVKVMYFYPDVNAAYTDFGTAVIASGGTDFVDPRGAFTLRLTDSQIIVTDFNFSAFWLPASFNGLIVTNLSERFPSELSIDPATTMSGFGAGNVALFDNELRINWQGLSFDPGTRVVINLGVVPELPAWTMLAAGLALLGMVVWRRPRGRSGGRRSRMQGRVLYNHGIPPNGMIS